MANKVLTAAKNNKKDEFYTQLTDIEKELRYYRKHFKGKTVLCNCDDPYESNFFKYFVLNFNRLGLKKLIATCYASSPIVYTQLSLFDVGETVCEEKFPAYKAEVTKSLLYEADFVEKNESSQFWLLLFFFRFCCQLSHLSSSVANITFFVCASDNGFSRCDDNFTFNTTD